MSGYLISYLPGGLIGVCRPGENDPAFMVPTINEAFDLIEIDKGMPEPLNRCVGCVKEECPCLPQ